MPAARSRPHALAPCLLATYVAVIGVALALAGCGGGSGDPASPTTAAAGVKRAVRAALADLARDDGRAFCALTTPAARARIGQILHGYDCARLARQIGRHLSSAARTGLLHAHVSHVTVNGASATVSSDAITSTRGRLEGLLNDGGTPTTLVRGRDGGWRIAPRPAGAG